MPSLRRWTSEFSLASHIDTCKKIHQFQVPSSGTWVTVFVSSSGFCRGSYQISIVRRYIKHSVFKLTLLRGFFYTYSTRMHSSGLSLQRMVQKPQGKMLCVHIYILKTLLSLWPKDNFCTKWHPRWHFLAGKRVK